MTDPSLVILVFHLRPARIKAREAGVAEALSLLEDVDASAPSGGPLADTRGVFWITVPPHAIDQAVPRLTRLGYTSAVDLAQAVSENTQVRWRKQSYRLVRLYTEQAEETRNAAPDRREFLLEDAEGQVRSVRGYRGDGGELSRRGLPVCDAKLLANLAGAHPGAKLLDPFAGVGGIVTEALAAGCSVVSADIDPVLRHGLAHQGGHHLVADACNLPLRDRSIDAVATEPPYHESADAAVLQAISEMRRVLKPGGRLAMLCAARQADPLRIESNAPTFEPMLDLSIDRKGTAVHLFVWRRPG